MGTYTQILYQIVFGTKFRKPVLLKQNRELLFKHISGIVRNKKCHLYIINGVEDHIHILTHLHPSVSLASLVKDVKISTSLFIKERNLFSNFEGWQEGYGAFTYAFKDKDRLINYIKRQEQHHKRKAFREEYLKLLKEHDVGFEEKYV